MRRLGLAVLSLAFLPACQPGVAPLTEADITALYMLRMAYINGMLAHDCGAATVMYAEDAVLLPQNQPTVEGLAAIRAACEEGPTPLSLRVASAQLDGYGDLAFDRGTWAEEYAIEGMEEPLEITGKYVVIARKQADGSWLWTVDIWNHDAPLPQPEQP